MKRKKPYPGVQTAWEDRVPVAQRGSASLLRHQPADEQGTGVPQKRWRAGFDRSLPSGRGGVLAVRFP